MSRRWSLELGVNPQYEDTETFGEGGKGCGQGKAGKRNCSLSSCKRILLENLFVGKCSESPKLFLSFWLGKDVLLNRRRGQES